MDSFQALLSGFFDTLTGHLALAVYLLAVTGEGLGWRWLRRLPPLLASPLLATVLSAVLYTLPGLGAAQYFLVSCAILVMAALWVRWAWGFGFWQAFAAVCMAGILQVAGSTLTWMLNWAAPFGEGLSYAAAAILHLAVALVISLLLGKLGFGRWFRLLLESGPTPRRTGLLLFAQEMVMELFLLLLNSVQSRYLVLYYLLVVVMVILMTVLVVYLAQGLDTAQKLRAQRDMIAQQQLYERELETIRQETRAFRHDYKNLLAGLSQQAGEGELEKVRRTLTQLDVGFDLRLGRRIQLSTQIGNIQLPEVRSLLLSKLAAMGERGVECRLEALYPVGAVDMDIWDLTRCLGILLDNALEAALETEEPWVEILLLAQEGKLFLRVSNPYTGSLDPGKLWEEGWSTKGTGRGLGLSGYQRILRGYPNASSCTRWDRGIFVQELTVEDRT